MADHSEIPTADAVEAFVASLSLRSAPVNTIKSYAHDLRLFVRAVPADLSTVTAAAIQAFLTGDGHHSPATLQHALRFLSLAHPT
jgi:site-specific recombinase XerD